jgi:hypothetical protein
MPGGGKHAHVQTYLGHDHLRHPARNSGNGHDEVQHAVVCPQQHVDLLVGLRDRGLEKVDMGKHLRNQQAVVFAAESMGQRLAQCRDLGAQSAFGQLGQHRRVVLPG